MVKAYPKSIGSRGDYHVGHQILGNRWNVACYSAHQAPPRLLVTLPSILGRLMYQALSCPDNFFALVPPCKERSADHIQLFEVLELTSPLSSKFSIRLFSSNANAVWNAMTPPAKRRGSNWLCKVPLHTGQKVANNVDGGDGERLIFRMCLEGYQISEHLQRR